MMATFEASRPRHPMRATGFTDPAFSRLADLAHLLAGLTFPPNRQPSAEAGMRRAMSTLRISDPDSLLRAVETPGNARDVVLAELTVGESYFFRDAPPLDALITDILQARARSNNPTRPLRVWSAGCASGEEPYSVALMLRERGWVHGAQIVGTDIALPRLTAAKRGRYTRWALRGVSDERVARWFHRSGTNFDLDRAIGDSVEFRMLNLVCDAYDFEQKFDLVLCRNVMIYFELGTVAAVARKLLDSLDDDGWLALGASDPPLATLVECDVVMTPVGVAYRKVVGGGPRTSQVPNEFLAPVSASRIDWHSPEVSHVAPLLLTQAEVIPTPAVFPIASAFDARPMDGKEAPVDYKDVRAAYERADYPTAESLAALALASAHDDDEDAPQLWILYIRAVANQGRLHEAGELCARAIETHPLDAELHYLHATLLMEAGWYADAAIAARRSIYLDRKLVVSHLLLGDAHGRIGETAAARTSFSNAIKLLAKVDPDEIVKAADGVPASRLRQIATLRLRNLPDVPRK